MSLTLDSRNSRGLSATTLAAALLALAVSLAAPRAAHACSCAPPPPPQEAMASAAAVFEGRIGAQAEGTFASSGGGTLPGRSARVAVLRAWRGATAGDEVVVWTGMSSASCGYDFQPGGTYLIYATALPEGAGFATGLCSRTARSADAAADFAALGNPTSTGGPAPVVPSSPQPPQQDPPPAAVPHATSVGCAGCAVSARSGTRGVRYTGLAVASFALVRARRRRR